MIYSDDKTAKRLQPFLRRVLVIDPSTAGSKLLCELLKGLGAGSVEVEANDLSAMAACKSADPQIILTEWSGKGLDGAAFTRTLRRSQLPCRKAPVIMVTCEATAAAIVAARNAGVHEFLRKPFTTKDFIRRLEAVTLRSRDWIEAVGYVGPDRRRFNSGQYEGPRKRRSDNTVEPDSARLRQALNILAAAVAAIESDPAQALRSMQAQVVELRRIGMASSNSRLVEAATALQRLLAIGAEGALSRPHVEAGTQALWPFMPEDGVQTSVAA